MSLFRDEKGRFIRNPNLPPEPVEEPIATGFKGTNEAGYCQRTKYTIGRKYAIRENPVLCSRGYHYCERPVDVFSYYGPSSARFFTIEAYGKVATGMCRVSGFADNPNAIDVQPMDTKRAAKGIKLVKELPIADMVRAQWDIDMKRELAVIVPSETFQNAFTPADVIIAIKASDNNARAYITRYAGATSKEAFISHGSNCVVALAARSTSLCNASGSIAISMGSISMAYAKGRSSIAIAYESQSVAMTDDSDSIAISSHCNNALISNGNNSIAIMPYMGGKMEVYGDNSVSLVTCSYIYTYGRNNVVVFRSYDEWGKHGKFKEGTLVVFMRERTAPIAIRIGKDVPFQDEYEIPKLRKAAEKAQRHAVLIKNPSHTKLVDVREEITNLLGTIDLWNERKDDIYMNNVKTRLNEILATIDDSPWKGKKKNGQAD